MNQILHYFRRIWPAVVLTLVLWGVSKPVRAERLAKKGLVPNRWHEGALAVFLVLIAGLMWLTVLPEFYWAEGKLVYAFEGFGLVNLRPFVIFQHSKILGLPYFLINFVGNIVMFLPIGFFPPLLWRKGKLWKAGLQGLCLSCLIELCQIPIHRGTDVDDLWLNTLGALLGYGLYRLLKRVWPQGSEKFQVTEEKA